jgi:hypothetical protein
VPRHGGLRKRPCDFCGGKGFKVPKKTLAKLTGRRFICAAPPNQFPRAHWEPSNEHLAIMSVSVSQPTRGLAARRSSERW